MWSRGGGARDFGGVVVGQMSDRADGTGGEIKNKIYFNMRLFQFKYLVS